jgi:hypothetical protein
MKRRTGSSLAVCTVAGAAAALWACGEVADPGNVGTISFDFAAIPPNITSVVARVGGDSVVLTPANTDSSGLAARGSMTVSVGTHIVQVDAYEASERWYTGKDTVEVVAGQTVPATVVMRCVNAGCDGPPAGGISFFGAFPLPESEPNNTIASCDTTSWSRNFDLITGPGVWAPYTYGGSGTIASDTDVDFWCAFISFTAGDSLVAFTGNVLASNDNAGGENPSDARVEWDVTASGRYYLAVSAAGAPASPGRYSVFMHVGLPQTIP